jgi:hypothetical protein
MLRWKMCRYTTITGTGVDKTHYIITEVEAESTVCITKTNHVDKLWTLRHKITIPATRPEDNHTHLLCHTVGKRTVGAFTAYKVLLHVRFPW